MIRNRLLTFLDENKSVMLIGSIVLVVLMNFINPYFLFYTHPSSDEASYLGLKILYEYNIFEYFSTYLGRISALLPQRIAYELFGFTFGHTLNFFMTLSLSCLGFYKVLNFTHGKEVALYLVFLVVISPFFIGSIISHHPAGFTLIYILFSFYYSLMSENDDNAKLYVFLSGLFYILAIHSELRCVIYTGYIPLLAFCLNRKEFFKRFFFFVFGCLIATLFVSFVNYFYYGKDFLFFNHQLNDVFFDIIHKNYNGDLSFKEKMMTANPEIIITFFTVVAAVLSRKYSKKFLLIFSAYFLPQLVYYFFMGGMLFNPSCFTWILPVFLLFLGAFFKTLKIPSSVFIGFVIFAMLSRLDQFDSLHVDQLTTSYFEAAYTVIVGMSIAGFILGCIFKKTHVLLYFVLTLFCSKLYPIGPSSRSFSINQNQSKYHFEINKGAYHLSKKIAEYTEGTEVIFIRNDSDFFTLIELFYSSGIYPAKFNSIKDIEFNRELIKDYDYIVTFESLQIPGEEKISWDSYSVFVNKKNLLLNEIK